MSLAHKTKICKAKLHLYSVRKSQYLNYIPCSVFICPQADSVFFVLNTQIVAVCRKLVHESPVAQW